MKKSLLQVIYLSASLSFVIAACTPNQEPVVYSKEDVSLQKYNWKGEVPRKSRVKVINHYGNISSRNTSHDNVELSGIIQKVGPKAPTPEIQVSDVDGVTLITVVYKNSPVDNHANRIGRMDIGVYVPRGVTIEMESDFGDIKAKKHQSNIIANSQSGKIKLATSGTINAVSQNGKIKANLLPWANEKFQPAKKKRRYEIHSVEGDVEVYVDPESGFEVNLQAGNGISSRSSDLQTLLTQNSQTLNFAIGDQDRQLTVTSGQGNIQFNTVSRSEQTTRPVAAQSFEGDVRDLPQVEDWKPGDPIIEMQDGRSDKDVTKPEKETKEFNRRPPKKEKQDDEG